MKQNFLEQKAFVEQWLARRPRQLSSLSFVNIFLWQEHFDFEFKEINGRLCVFAVNPLGTFMYFPPLGQDLNRETVEACFTLMRERNHGRGVGRVEHVDARELVFFPEERFAAYHKGYEYVYSRADIAGLEGGDYKSKRHDYNVFVKNHAAQYLPFTLETTDECLALYDRWAQGRRAAHNDPVYCQMLDDNHGAHRLGMEYFKELGLVGRVVVIEGNVAAYTFGYALEDKIFCVLFEIADLGFRGLPVYIFTEFCRDPALAKYNFINVMDDFGMKNLERTKNSFRPTVLLPSYAVSERA